MTGPLVEIEARAYGPDSTPAEIAAIQARMSIAEGNILILRELPVMSPFTVDILYDRLEQLCRAQGCSLLLVDATVGSRPDAATRKRLSERTRRLRGRLVHVAVAIHANPLVRAAARFVQASFPIPLSLHSTADEAMEALRRVERR